MARSTWQVTISPGLTASTPAARAIIFSTNVAGVLDTYSASRGAHNVWPGTLIPPRRVPSVMSP